MQNPFAHTCVCPPPVQDSVSYFQKIEGDSSSLDASAFGKAVATIDASALYVLSFLWALDNYDKAIEHVKREGPSALSKCLVISDSHSIIYINLVHLGLGVSDRIFATMFSWREEPDGSYVFAFAPVEEYVRERIELTSDTSKRYKRALSFQT